MRGPNQELLARYTRMRELLGERFLEELQAEWLDWLQRHARTLPCALLAWGELADGYREAVSVLQQVMEAERAASPIRGYDARLDQTWVVE